MTSETVGRATESTVQCGGALVAFTLLDVHLLSVKKTGHPNQCGNMDRRS